MNYLTLGILISIGGPCILCTSRARIDPQAARDRDDKKSNGMTERIPVLNQKKMMSSRNPVLDSISVLCISI